MKKVSSKLKESNSDVSVYKFNIESDSELVSSLGVRHCRPQIIFKVFSPTH